MKTVKGQIIEERDINNGPKNPEQAAAVQRETERVAQETQAALEILDGAAQRETERVARETQDALNRAAEDAKKSKWNPKNWF